jgi:hypothetical protein
LDSPPPLFPSLEIPFCGNDPASRCGDFRCVTPQFFQGTAKTVSLPTAWPITSIGRKRRSPGIKAKLFSVTARISHGRVAETASPAWPCRRSYEKLLPTPFVPARVNVSTPCSSRLDLYGPEHAAAPVHLAMNDLLPPANPGTGPGFPPLLPILCCGQPSPPHLPRHPIRYRNLVIQRRFL